MLIVAALMVYVVKHITSILNQKYPTQAEPTFYESKIKPTTDKWNPTIVSLVVIGILAIVLGGWGFDYTAYKVGNQQGYAPDQPINFPHDKHAGAMNIDCQYCHIGASKSKHSTIPSSNICMNCHKGAQLREKYNGQVSPELAKLYKYVGFDPEAGSYDPNAKGVGPIKWVRVHNLPDLAYFNHSQHVSAAKLAPDGSTESKDICNVCHGPVHEMAKLEQFSTLQMGWCVNCHRQRGIDVENNKYYEDVHKEMKKNNKHYVTVAENGGLECSKCHY